jgi:biopolymer transport protein ExbB
MRRNPRKVSPRWVCGRPCGSDAVRALPITHGAWPLGRTCQATGTPGRTGFPAYAPPRLVRPFGVNGPFAALPPLTGVPLLLLSIAVLTVAFERGRWWLGWWRARGVRRRRRWRWHRQPEALARQLVRWDWQMRSGEPLLQAATVLAPLLGLTGTVLALIGVLGSLGPDLTLPPTASLQGYGQVLMSTLVGLLVSLLASATLLLNQGLRRWQLGRVARLGGLAPQAAAAPPGTAGVGP